MLSTLTRITMISGILAATAIPVFAATEGRSDPADFLVWGFLSLCALIILTQVVPMISNLKKQSKIAASESKTAKVSSSR